ncbi:hypothetical protein Bca4012_036812 [Brassica carinata]
MADPLKQMCEELGVCQEEALFYLEGFRWDLNAAMEACRSKTLPSPAQPPNERAAVEERRRSNTPPLAHDDHTKPGYKRGFSGNERSDLMQDVLSKVPHTPPLELTQESIKRFRDVVSEASPQAAIDCLTNCNGNLGEAVLYFCQVYNKKNPTEWLSDETKEERIASFSSMSKSTRQVAKYCLEQNKWDIDQALNFFFKHGDELISAMILSMMENTDPPLPSMGQSQFESSYVSSGPTETQRSLEEAGEGDVTVAIPGMASSQVDDGKAAEEEGSSTETVPDPFANRDRTTVETQTAAPGTIVMTITLASGTSLELPFRSDQTVRDIRNAIDQRYPDIDRGYVLRSMDGVDYMDWNITVHRVTAGGYTALYQINP